MNMAAKLGMAIELVMALWVSSAELFDPMHSPFME
jgi:hypothetical protein